MSQLSLFISCVSNEFGNYRDALRRDLSRPNLTTKIQEDFIAYGASTLEKLDDYIGHCQAVIHLCGHMTGSPANRASLAYIQQTYPDFATRFPELQPVLEGKEELSYTQWEAWLAVYHQKKLIIAVPGQDAPRNIPYQLVPAQLQQQQRHLERLKAQGHHPGITFSTVDGLSKEVYRSSLYDLLVQLQLPAVKPVSLPYHSLGDLFKGREPWLERLYTELHTSQLKPAVITGKTLHGLGGVGKTRLAVEYAWRYQELYSALLFVVADGPDKLFDNLAALCAPPVLNLPEYNAPEERRRYESVIQWLNQHPGWLLILDNADTPQSAKAVEKLFGQLQGGHVLITSRQTNWSRPVSQMRLEVLTPEAAASFLLERTQDKRRKLAEDEHLAGQLAGDLGGLALALEQAGAYIATRRLTLAQYRQAWQSQHRQVLEWKDERLMQYPHSVAVTWQTTVKQLTAPARTLLDRLAWLGPEPVPESLLNVSVPEEEPIDGYAALAELGEYSMVDRRDDKPEFSVHRLVQDVTRIKQAQKTADKHKVACLRWINEGFVGDSKDVRDWPVLEPLVPHALAVLSGSNGRPAQNGIINRLLNLLSLFRLTKAQSRDNRVKSRLLNQLGLFYLVKAQYREAEPLMRRALQIDERSLGKDHPSVAVRLNNLAQLLKDTNRLAEAEPLVRRALQIDEQSLGKDHPSVAVRLNNLALLLQDTNRLAEAEPLVRRALQIDEQSLGKDHPDVAIDLNNLAQLLKDTNRLAEAEPLMRRALQIDLQSFGKDHPSVARDLNNLAQLLQATNRLAEAEPLMRRALQIDEQSFGKDHPSVARDLNNLAQLLKVTNRLVEAEPLMRRALQIDEQSFGKDHPDVAIGLNNLAQLLQDTNRLVEAEPLMRRALQINLRSFGKDHPHTRTVGVNYIMLLQEMGKSDEEIRHILSSVFG
jgi:tetratricopeptide (TPR) repeat protein